MSEYKKKFVLDEERIPKAWYNIVADLPTPPPPPLNPATLQPAGPDDLSPIFSPSIIAQEVSAERYIEIPEEVHQIYRIWRPTPLIRATGLEKALDTPAKIFFKYEGVSPAGSHKSNTAVAQAYYNKLDGTTRLATETGAGQWGSALSMACQMFDLECMVYMVKVSYHQKPYRRSMMRALGRGRDPQPERPDQRRPRRPGRGPGLAGQPRHRHQRGGRGRRDAPRLQLRAGQRDQPRAAASDDHRRGGDPADARTPTLTRTSSSAASAAARASAGSPSRSCARTSPARRDTRLVAVEPTACPTLTKGQFRYDFGDEAETTPLFKMYTLGHDFMPPGIHAGGLRYHAMAPLLSHVYDLGLMEAVAVPQTKVFEAAQLFVKTEGIVPAPESAHAILAAIDEALKAKEEGVSRNILFNLTGHGLLDLGSYDSVPERQARGLRPSGRGDRRVDREAPRGRLDAPERAHRRVRPWSASPTATAAARELRGRRGCGPAASPRVMRPAAAPVPGERRRVTAAAGPGRGGRRAAAPSRRRRRPRQWPSSCGSSPTAMRTAAAASSVSSASPSPQATVRAMGTSRRAARPSGGRRPCRPPARTRRGSQAGWERPAVVRPNPPGTRRATRRPRPGLRARRAGSPSPRLGREIVRRARVRAARPRPRLSPRRRRARARTITSCPARPEARGGGAVTVPSASATRAPW